MKTTLFKPKKKKKHQKLKTCLKIQLLTPSVWSMREKYEKLDFIKVKNFYKTLLR